MAQSTNSVMSTGVKEGSATASGEKTLMAYPTLEVATTQELTLQYLRFSLLLQRYYISYLNLRLYS